MMSRTLPLLAAGLIIAAGLFFASAAGRAAVDNPFNLVYESHRSEALDCRMETFRRLGEAKRQVATEVAEGRMGLREAARQFGRQQEELDDGYDDVLGPVNLPRDEEALCRNVIGWVEAMLSDDPDRAGPVVGRLEEDYCRSFGRTTARLSHYRASPADPALPR